MFPPDKIFSAEQIKKADQFTTAFEPISSIDLMERAAKKCTEWIVAHNSVQSEIKIFCGTGNNGGDGLAIARMLTAEKFVVSVFLIAESDKFSDDFIENRKRLLSTNNTSITSVITMADFPLIQSNAILIDAIFGTGLQRPITGLIANCIKKINDSRAKIVSIDLPAISA